MMQQPSANASPRAIWRQQRRIVHALAFKPDNPAKVHRLGLRPVSSGYFKCGSMNLSDWITRATLYHWSGQQWQAIWEGDCPAVTSLDDTHWIDVQRTTTGLLLVADQCDLDAGWPGWNLLAQGVVAEGELPDAARPIIRSHHVQAVDTAGCPDGVVAAELPGEVRYRTAWYEVGFRLLRAGMSYLAVDDEGLGRTGRNLVKVQPLAFGPSTQAMRDMLAHGPTLRAVGEAVTAGLLAYDVQGVTRIHGNRVSYDLHMGDSGLSYQLQWQMHPRRISLRVTTQVTRRLQAWDSSAWQISLDAASVATSCLGQVTREGQAGLMHLPILLHAPGHGTFRVTCREGQAQWRYDSWRHGTTLTAEIKVGQTANELGDYTHTPGSHHAHLDWEVCDAGDAMGLLQRTEQPLSRHHPVARAVRRCAWTALSYRPDTATFSNNANSIHAVICMDNWSAVATQVKTLLPACSPMDLMRDTLERWLDGGPAYACGRVRISDGGYRDLDDEYLMSGCACLRGLADYLEQAGTHHWLDRYAPAIAHKLDALRARDLDGDGLIESPYRRGISGEHQWSTCWYDVVSFGGKDAFTNAILYSALTRLPTAIDRLGAPLLSRGLDDWRRRLRQAYRTTFFNPDTGWLGGWRSTDGVLHDYGFLFVNGCAVCADLLEADEARAVISRLWERLRALGALDFRMGLPGNLLDIPPSDTAMAMPFGLYMNGTLNHAQARHFIGALYHVGMRSQADELLEALCDSLANGYAFGGVGSGLDWRRWDGHPTGYEGILTDQFGILALAHHYAAQHNAAQSMDENPR